MRTGLMFTMTLGCSSDMEIISPCVEEAHELALNEAGSAGFTPADVYRVVDGAVLDVVLDDTRSGRLALPYATSWDVRTGLTGTPTQLVRGPPEQGHNPTCRTGTFLVVPVDLTLSSVDGVWELAAITTLEAGTDALEQITFAPGAAAPVMLRGPQELELDEEDGLQSCGGVVGTTEVNFYDSPLSGGRLRVEIAYGDCDAQMYQGQFTGTPAP